MLANTLISYNLLTQISLHFFNFSILAIVEDFNLETVSGKALQVMNRNNRVYINRTRTINKDVMSTDGVIHTIHRVFYPPSTILLYTIDSVTPGMHSIMQSSKHLNMVTISLKQQNLLH